ncbi:MAG: hypothetical protein AMK72_03020 [Planctomycetes bacterium SM23_25]|nr:MAG: hypothetical protein AMK72_03020 [Planctomycetes bacterium SM23_25]
MPGSMLPGLCASDAQSKRIPAPPPERADARPLAVRLGQAPGATIQQQAGRKHSVGVTGLAVSACLLRPIETAVNGRGVKRPAAGNRKTHRGGYGGPLAAGVELTGASWIAVRVFEQRPDERIRFAHSSPVHVDIAGRPLRLRREEVNYLIRRRQEELKRCGPVLRPDGLAEYRKALAAYEALAEQAR